MFKNNPTLLGLSTFLDLYIYRGLPPPPFRRSVDLLNHWIESPMVKHGVRAAGVREIKEKVFALIDSMCSVVE